MKELKPCPFCGGEDVMTMLCGDGYYVVCYSRNKGKCCGSSTGWHETEREAIEAWNKRVTPTTKDIEEYIEKTHKENMEEVAKLKRKYL